MLSIYRAGEIDLFENLDIFHIRLLVETSGDSVPCRMAGVTAVVLHGTESQKMSPAHRPITLRGMQVLLETRRTFVSKRVWLERFRRIRRSTLHACTHTTVVLGNS